MVKQCSPVPVNGYNYALTPLERAGGPPIRQINVQRLGYRGLTISRKVIVAVVAVRAGGGGIGARRRSRRCVRHAAPVDTVLVVVVAVGPAALVVVMVVIVAVTRRAAERRYAGLIADKLAAVHRSLMVVVAVVQRVQRLLVLVVVVMPGRLHDLHEPRVPHRTTESCSEDLNEMNSFRSCKQAHFVLLQVTISDSVRQTRTRAGSDNSRTHLSVLRPTRVRRTYATPRAPIEGTSSDVLRVIRFLLTSDGDTHQAAWCKPNRCDNPENRSPSVDGEGLCNAANKAIDIGYTQALNAAHELPRAMQTIGGILHEEHEVVTVALAATVVAMMMMLLLLLLLLLLTLATLLQGARAFYNLEKRIPAPQRTTQPGGRECNPPQASPQWDVECLFGSFSSARTQYMAGNVQLLAKFAPHVLVPSVRRTGFKHTDDIRRQFCIRVASEPIFQTNPYAHTRPRIGPPPSWLEEDEKKMSEKQHQKQASASSALPAAALKPNPPPVRPGSFGPPGETSGHVLVRIKSGIVPSESRQRKSHQRRIQGQGGMLKRILCGIACPSDGRPRTLRSTLLALRRWQQLEVESKATRGLDHPVARLVGWLGALVSVGERYRTARSKDGPGRFKTKHPDPKEQNRIMHTDTITHSFTVVESLQLARVSLHLPNKSGPDLPSPIAIHAIVIGVIIVIIIGIDVAVFLTSINVKTRKAVDKGRKHPFGDPVVYIRRCNKHKNVRVYTK
uniref:Uncharacterized protein n=1 Tax=Anopheles atroparvus TaxID=41427 RepID=A0A182J8I7_ANOAO